MKVRRSIAFISDTHCGSAYALFPKEYTTARGVKILANHLQLQILNHWNLFWKECDRLNVDTIIHLADALDGLDKKAFGETLVVASLDEQKEIFYNLMLPHIKKRTYIGVSGSPYHESMETRVHAELARRLGGHFFGYVGYIKLKGTNTTMNIAHGAGGAAVYRSTYLDRESMFMKLAESCGKLPKIDLVARGHLHFYEYIDLGYHSVLQVPCWEMYKPYARSLKLLGRMQPDIGGVIVQIGQDGDKEEIRVKKILLDNLQFSAPVSSL